jgi:hypothetical protein
MKGDEVDDSPSMIPLEAANQILVAFGISKPTPVYERRVKPDGFRPSDLYDVLSESRFLFVVDWRGWLEDFVEEALPALAELGSALTYEPDDDGNSGMLKSDDGRSQRIKYVPTDSDCFDDVIRAMQRLAGKGIEFRQSPCNMENDTWMYAALGADEWKELEAINHDFILSHFIPLWEEGPYRRG